LSKVSQVSYWVKIISKHEFEWVVKPKTNNNWQGVSTRLRKKTLWQN